MTDFPPVVIRASAGTGKTFQLSNRYLRLLFAGENPDRILATTFTRKAAREIASRVVERIALAAQSGEGSEDLQRQLEGVPFGELQAREVLSRIIKHQHRLQICTLDSLCIQLARSFSFEIGLESGWSLLETHRDAELRAEAIRRVCTQQDSSKLAQLVQLLSKGDVGRSVHRKLEADVQALYEVFCDSEKDAWLWLEPPTPLSDAELAALSEQIRNAELPKTKSGTPNKRFLSAIEADLAALQLGEWGTFPKRGICKALLSGQEEFYRTPIPETLLVSYRRLLQQVGSVLLSELRHQTLASLELLSLFDTEYREQKNQTASYSFTDVKQALAASSVLGELEEMYFRLDTRLPHVLLDEFQDTSRNEWQVLDPIVDETLSDASGAKSFFCVGDVKQAIYGWRGGVAEIFDSLEARWPILESIPMVRSYRSSPVIMDLVNQVLTDLTSSDALDSYPRVAADWDAAFQEHSSARAELAGCVSFQEVSPEGDLLFEAAQCAEELTLQNPNLSIAILVRRNRDVAALIHELRHRGVAASEEGGNPLTDSQAVSLLLSLLHWVDHPGDSIAHYHVFHSPLGEALQLPSLVESQKGFFAAQQLRRALHERGYAALLVEWSQVLAASVPANEKRRLSQLVELAHRYDASMAKRSREFIEYVKTTKVDDPASASIRVMTVHQSKGLEFDAVILPELDRPLLRGPRTELAELRPDPLEPPTHVSRATTKEVRQFDETLQQMYDAEQQKKLREELSVLYVALTRAKHALYMFTQASASGRKTGLSHSALLRERLALNACGAVLFQDGDPHWFASLPAEGTETSEVSPTARLQFQPVSARTRALPRRTPSGLEGESKVALDQEMQRAGAQAALKGSIIHKLFEQIEWLDEGLPTRELLRKSVLSLSHDDTLLEQCLDEFLEQLKQEKLAELFNSSSYRERGEVVVRNEYPFVFREEGHLVSGYIDRLLLFSEGARVTAAEVIDFKTDRTSDVEERLRFYRPQLEAYRAAVARLYGLPMESISSKLVFVTLGNVYE